MKSSACMSSLYVTVCSSVDDDIEDIEIPMWRRANDVIMLAFSRHSYINGRIERTREFLYDVTRNSRNVVLEDLGFTVGNK